MQALELRVPPPALAVLVAVAMWGSTLLSAPLDLVAGLHPGIPVVIALIGAGIGLAGRVSFRRAKTTFNPMKPERATALVRSGIYRVTRNPMYLGLLLVLLAWAVYLAAGWAFLGPPAFLLYMTRFQIIPEERALAALFGAEYAAYKADVRRWL
jgi:protein-S-isoprenylcysteine O-methyltransferase Ste14